MTDQSESSEVSEESLRAQRAYSWWMPILWGMGIAVVLGTVVAAVIILYLKGLMPSWVFDWISSDREIQKRQFLRMLYGLLALWGVTRLVKLGLFGEIARTTYGGVLSKLKISQGEPDAESHARFCALRNVRSALFLVGFFTLEGFLSWRALGKPFLEHNLYDLFFQIFLWVVVLFPVLVNISRCVPERFILGIVMFRFVTGWVVEFAPNLVEPVAGLVRQCTLVLWILAFLISVTMLVSSLSNPKSA
jgi:hypothetical protein